MFKKIDLYIIRKFVGTYFYAIGLIIAIAVVFDISEKLDDFMERGAPLEAILFDYYMNFIPYFANLFSSLFTFIAVIFFTSKMAYNTEIIAILASGVSFKRLMWPYFLGALIIVILSMVLANFIIPPANKERMDFSRKYLKNVNIDDDKNIHRQIGPDLYVYINNFNSNRNTGVRFTLEQFDGKDLKSKLTANSVEWSESQKKWIVKNYTIRNITDEGEEIIKGSQMDTTLNLRPDEFNRQEKFVESMDFFELQQFIKEEKFKGSSNINEYKIENYSRFSGPFASFILTLIGVCVASRKSKGGIGLHIGIGLGLSFTFILFMKVFNTLGANGGMPPAIAVWVPNVIFALVGVFLYRYASR